MNYPDDVIRCAQELCRFCGDVAQFEEDCPSDEAEGRPCIPIISENDLRWAICERCSGDGVLVGYPGAYTADAMDEDPDFFQEYMAHRRFCEDCDGLGRVRDVEPNAELDALAQEYWEDENVSRMERMYGA